MPDGTEPRPVLHHDPLDADGSGYLDRNTETLRNVGAATTGHDEDLTASDPIPMTERDEALCGFADQGGRS
ncbi:hypothetical protein [Curtobacterium sp. MCBD17_032]|uniref:hypothetical protein n=1 Tax=Curtobacterium sp. MCBD17_032 TaxID=2175659 RepID=UPI000DA79972|nr:hypothetical protein [Curtobacterium sp. MCBD17_032]PZE85007.1 hypothetical protein DEI91_06020 [Curtobacterium sp. MCBD17_032]